MTRCFGDGFDWRGGCLGGFQEGWLLGIVPLRPGATQPRPPGEIPRVGLVISPLFPHSPTDRIELPKVWVPIVYLGAVVHVQRRGVQTPLHEAVSHALALQHQVLGGAILAFLGTGARAAVDGVEDVGREAVLFGYFCRRQSGLCSVCTAPGELLRG